jgi:hypothetical protein
MRQVAPFVLPKRPNFAAPPVKPLITVRKSANKTTGLITRVIVNKKDPNKTTNKEPSLVTDYLNFPKNISKHFKLIFFRQKIITFAAF